MSNTTRPLGITEIITRIGDEKIQLQRLGAGYLEAQEGTRDCKISFATTKGTALAIEAEKVIGLVLWINRADYDAMLEARKQEAPAIPPTPATFLANLKAVIALFPDVDWDRYAGDEHSASLFGWVPRTDGKRDFLLVKFIGGEVDSYATSSAKHTADFADRLDCEHSTCQPVAGLFQPDPIEP